MLARTLRIRECFIILCSFLPFLGIREGECMAFEIVSKAFQNETNLSSQYTCDGRDISPALEWREAPSGTESFALVMDDPDAPMGTWVHWVIYDIPMVSKIAEHTIPGTQGYNDFRRNDYGGPCPP